MIYEVEIAFTFEQKAKKLIKKHPSLNTDLQTFISGLENGSLISSDLGNSFYKYRMAISPKGKRGSARIIVHSEIILFHQKEKLTLLTIYLKNEQADITRKEILELAKKNSLV
jgi:hypothetical protein